MLGAGAALGTTFPNFNEVHIPKFSDSTEGKDTGDRQRPVGVEETNAIELFGDISTEFFCLAEIIGVWTPHGGG